MDGTIPGYTPAQIPKRNKFRDVGATVQGTYLFSGEVVALGTNHFLVALDGLVCLGFLTAEQALHITSNLGIWLDEPQGGEVVDVADAIELIHFVRDPGKWDAHVGGGEVPGPG